MDYAAKLNELRVPDEPQDQNCLHCVLIVATEKFRLEHRAYSPTKLFHDLGDLIGCNVASMVFGNPHVDGEKLKQEMLTIIMERAQKSTEMLLTQLEATRPKN